jgi:hypothetical protein
MTEIHALHGNVFQRKPKREDPKLSKPEMAKQIMTVHWRRKHDKYPRTWEQWDAGAVD